MKALLIIDMLNDFVRDDGALPVPIAKNLIKPINSQINEFRKAGEPIIFVCDSHDENDKEFKAWPKHAIEGTEGAEIVGELNKRPEDIVVRKKRYSAFYNTELDKILKEKKVDTLLITGVLTDICVLYTAADGVMRDYKVVVLKDCVGSTSTHAHEWAIKHMKDILLIKVE
jgi:nicotinamidase-related amidase